MAALAPEGPPWPAAVAVSGGGDSLALMHLMAEWAKARDCPLPIVLTVDHGLRPGSTAEAKQVARKARAAGLQAHVLAWTGPKPRAGIEAAARAARYTLMGAWCRRHGIAALYVAHNREDLAETFLLRLARGSGLDGLAAMPALAPWPLAGFEGLKLARPLLDVGRAELRGFLAERGVAWVEDPMNDDPRFARVRLRAAWPELEALGLTPSRIAAAAGHLARARAALEAQTLEFLAAHTHFDEGKLFFDAAALAAAPREIGLRALAAALGCVSGAAYRPRFERLERLFDAICGGTLGRGRTLQGCRIAPAGRRNAGFGAATFTISAERPRKG